MLDRVPYLWKFVPLSVHLVGKGSLPFVVPYNCAWDRSFCDMALIELHEAVPLVKFAHFGGWSLCPL